MKMRSTFVVLVHERRRADKALLSDVPQAYEHELLITKIWAHKEEYQLLVPIKQEVG
jgi:hypothetical protein